MRQSEAAVALIRRVEDGQTLWLSQWNPTWGAYHFVGGHKRPEELFRECLVREIGEELHLEPGADFLVRSDLPIHCEFDAFSVSTRVDTHYIMELFDVELVSEEARCTVDADLQNRWLTETEIRTGTTLDGRPVSPTMIRLLKAWQSEPERGVVD
jgi:8-oxo-dGTP pyrophosphatase MutT (NUDIX family)